MQSMAFLISAETEDRTYESSINLSIVEKLQKLLENSSYTVILTHSDENGIYELDSETIRQKKISDMKNRVEIGNHSMQKFHLPLSNVAFCQISISCYN